MHVKTDFKVLTFDVVGTLIDFETGIASYVQGVVERAGLSVDGETVLTAYRKARAMPGAGLFPDDLVRCYLEIARALGLPATDEAAQGLRQSVKDWPAFADSVEALARLRKRYKLVAMTNAQNWALAHFSRTLGNPFDLTVTVDDVGLEKPNPQFFAFARGRISAWGFGLKDILHVAQSQYHDIGVARELGYTVCWIERRKGRKGSGGTLEPARLTTPDFHYSTLAELADAVDGRHLTQVA
ncbi:MULTISPECIES: HAD-IA family hydrolase [unclassified Mesorhizobium]|uniref:HAD-IA family hydrolase n=1 Tax=unclassified Mesorhizobium TaxID=325217 RepID=UPI000FD8D19D|nr:MULTISPECIES: HAD-IA family hydrolase [unclassified Mesorhizobium]TGQ31033.1 HAD family hydrolase [Mesorhizobium sp. M00.F.Ca.ET.216.01.1.1]TIS55669.1 MAG: HAD family hydrolase [Mesorhizobium sp.]TIS86738.1 MAG: HAD family hydrolase [Mesorhizobium sp.]TJW06354.1 MAG: HAD family hydrolase [Mesorhizobium sp.]TJW45886.1 MAG: HAD family hydrolase [Mesorhizobium sp.]